MAPPRIPDLPDELDQSLAHRARLRRLDTLSRIQDRLDRSEPRSVSRPPEVLIREDRERGVCDGYLDLPSTPPVHEDGEVVEVTE